MDVHGGRCGPAARASRRIVVYSIACTCALGILGLDTAYRSSTPNGEPVAKANYRHARKQRELARKARQQEKQQRRSARRSSPGTDGPVEAAEQPVLPPSPSGDPT